MAFYGYTGAGLFPSKVKREVSTLLLPHFAVPAVFDLLIYVFERSYQPISERYFKECQGTGINA